MEVESLPERKREKNEGGFSDMNHYIATQSTPILSPSSALMMSTAWNFARVSEAGFYEQLKDWVATQLKGDTAVIAGIELSFPMASISLASGLPHNGEYWFKGMSLDLENYKPFLKTSYKDTHTHLMPFRYLLEKYAP